MKRIPLIIKFIFSSFKIVFSKKCLTCSSETSAFIYQSVNRYLVYINVKKPGKVTLTFSDTVYWF